VFKLPREEGGAWLQERRAEVSHEECWLDLSLRILAGDWLRRVEERFAGVNDSGLKALELQSYSSLDKPSMFVTSFLERYPLATEQLLAHENLVQDGTAFAYGVRARVQIIHLS
jgi:enoyl reductase-like protein